MDRILISKIEAWGSHGVWDAERAIPTRLLVDLEVSGDFGPAGRSDDPEQALDYVALVHTAREVVEKGTQRLLEAIAEEISRKVLLNPMVEAVTVRVAKPQVPVADFQAQVAVEVTRKKGSA